MYEVQEKGSISVTKAGIYNPFTHRSFEIDMPTNFGYTHTGYDVEGKLWFFEEQVFGQREPHNLYYLEKNELNGENKWIKLVGGLATYSSGQKSHFHPVLLSDRNWILMTGGDVTTSTNHIFLIEASDLEDTQGILDVAD